MKSKIKTVKYSELSNSKMTLGNENKYSKVIVEGVLKK